MSMLMIAIRCFHCPLFWCRYIFQRAHWVASRSVTPAAARTPHLSASDTWRTCRCEPAHPRSPIPPFPAPATAPRGGAAPIGEPVSGQAGGLADPELARSDTAGKNKRTSQVIFPCTPVYGARSHALVVRGRARAGLPRYDFCRSWRQAAALAVVNGMAGGQHCRRMTAGAAPCGRCFESHRPSWRWWQVIKRSPPALTAGGRALIPVFGAVLLHQSRHWSLPQPFLPMPGASQRAPHAQSDLLTCILHFDSWMYRRLPHILWKLVTRRV